MSDTLRPGEEKHLCRRPAPSPEGLRRASLLCFECFRSERERQRAWRLAELPATATPLVWPGSRELGSLTAAQAAHRLSMLRHLEGKSRAGGG